MRSAGILFVVLALFLIVPTTQVLNAAPMSGTVNVGVSTGGAIRTSPGGTGATLNHIFVPARIKVKVGTTVVWTNRHTVPEPHTATFLTPNMQTGEMKGGPPFFFGKPKPGKEGSKNPTDMDWVVHEQYFLPSELSGAKFLNSGFLFPPRMGPPNSPPNWKHTFTEMDAGRTLKYACALHPWMTGSVVVVK